MLVVFVLFFILALVLELVFSFELAFSFELIIDDSQFAPCHRQGFAGGFHDLFVVVIQQFGQNE